MTTPDTRATRPGDVPRVALGWGCPHCLRLSQPIEGTPEGEDEDNYTEIQEWGSVGATWGGEFDANGEWENDDNGAEMCWDAASTDSYYCVSCQKPFERPAQIFVPLIEGNVPPDVGAASDEAAPPATDQDRADREADSHGTLTCLTEPIDPDAPDDPVSDETMVRLTPKGVLGYVLMDRLGLSFAKVNAELDSIMQGLVERGIEIREV